MLDARPATACAPTAQPRAEGAAMIRAAVKGGRTRIAGLAMRGSAKCFVPRGPGVMEAVWLNTAGGLTGGDRFEWRAEAEAGAALVATTQAAERVYRAQPAEAPARVVGRAVLGAGARLDWLPQETILYDGGALDRRLEVEMAEDAVFTGVEALILGRAAMGETVREARFRDGWRLRRGGRLIWADGLRLVGPAAEIAGQAACLGGGIATATLVHAAPAAQARLDDLRGLIAGHEGVEAGASAFEGLVVARLVARDGFALRRALVAALTGLRGAQPPRVWRL
jgi:urease accessory protein